ncbi:MAG: radical SAM protein [Nanoarchaeota archaeon]
MNKNETLSLELKPKIYFNVNKNSGRWNFSDKNKRVAFNKSISELKEWDDKIKIIVVNITDKCNLNCVYCTRQYTRNNPKIMKKKVISEILSKAAKYARANNIEITIQFHGGEPLMEFKKIISAFDSLKEKGKENIRIRIQTNGTLLNERILKECKKRGIDIGISLDGRELENDITRKDISGIGTFKRVKKSLKLIKRYQKEVHCLTVVTNVNMKNLDEILDYFNKMGINEVGFLPLYEEPKTRTIKKEIIPNIRDLAKYQKILFDKWIKILRNKKSLALNISTFQILIWNLLSSNSSSKKFRTNCGVGVNSLFIESDGSIWGCGAFSYTKKLKIGNINQDNLKKILKSKARLQFKNRITSNVHNCKSCVFQFICCGGCVANGFRNNEDIYGIDVWCDYWKEIINHILLRIYQNPEIIKLIPEYNIIKKND